MAKDTGKIEQWPYFPTRECKDVAVAVALFDVEVIEPPQIPYEPGVFY